MKIPVFHDDQHGTAIIVGAAVLNGLKLVGKDIGEVKLVGSGAGAAAIACLDMLVSLGMQAREHLRHRHARAWSTRAATRRWTPNKARYAQPTTGAHAGRDHRRRRHLPRPVRRRRAEARDGQARWRAKPLILALANPEPEILPELAKQVRPDAIIAHRPLGLSEPGQQRPVLPVHLPRRARRRRDDDQRGDEARRACNAIAELARSRAVRHRRARPTATSTSSFGPDYLIPRPFDPRLIVKHRAGRGEGGDGQRRRDAADRGLRRLREQLAQFVYHSGMMHEAGVRRAAKRAPKRVVFAEGEDERVLRAVQVVVDEGLAHADPDRPADVIEQRIERSACACAPATTSRSSTSDDDPRYRRDVGARYHELMERNGVIAGDARARRCAAARR